MNLIQAYKDAKVGEKIYRPHFPSFTKTYDDDDFHNWFYKVLPKPLDESWQIEPRKPLVWEGEATFITTATGSYDIEMHYLSVNPYAAFQGKRTKIRIEEIVEETDG